MQPVTSSLKPPTVRPMTELANRLDQLVVDKSDQEIDEMTLTRLAQVTVTIGKTHVGKTFAEVWQHHLPWVKWMLRSYPTSQKPQHRMLRRFVRLQIMDIEAANDWAGVPYPAQTESIASPRAKAKSKAKAKSQAPMPMRRTPVLEGAEMDPEDWELTEVEQEMTHQNYLNTVETENQVITLQCEVAQLTDRMTGIENMLGQLLQHAQQQGPVGQHPVPQ